MYQGKKTIVGYFEIVTVVPNPYPPYKNYFIVEKGFVYH